MSACCTLVFVQACLQSQNQSLLTVAIIAWNYSALWKTAISVYQCIVSVGALSHQLIPILAIYPHDLQIYAGLCLKLHRNFASN